MHKYFWQIMKLYWIRAKMRCKIIHVRYVLENLSQLQTAQVKVLYKNNMKSLILGHTWNNIVLFFSESEGWTWLGALACLLRGCIFRFASWTLLCITAVTLLHRERNSCCSSKPESSKIRSGKELRALARLVRLVWLPIVNIAACPVVLFGLSSSSNGLSSGEAGTFPSHRGKSKLDSLFRCSFNSFRRWRSWRLNFSMQSSINDEGAFLWATVTFPQYKTSNFWEL